MIYSLFIICNAITGTSFVISFPQAAYMYIIQYRYLYNAVLWIRNDYFCSGSRLGSGSNSYYLSVLGNYYKRHLEFNQKEEYTNDLPFSISYYSPHSTLSPELEIKFLFICSFFFCWIRIRNNNSRSRKKFRIHADPDPQH